MWLHPVPYPGQQDQNVVARIFLMGVGTGNGGLMDTEVSFEVVKTLGRQLVAAL